METFRCPTCVGILDDPLARQCAACGQSLRRRRPRVLGEGHRITSARLPIDRWMLARLETSGRSATTPLAWHGRFATTPLGEPDFSATASQVEASLEPPTVAPTPPAEPDALAPTAGVLTLDQSTRPPAPHETTVESPAPAEAAPEPAAPASPEPAPQEELDPDVRVLVDELYQQARGELSGDDVSVFAWPDDGSATTAVERPAALDEQRQRHLSD